MVAIDIAINRTFYLYYDMLHFSILQNAIKVQCHDTDRCAMEILRREYVRL